VNDLDIHLHAIAAGDADAFGRWLAGSEFRVRASLSRFAAVVDVEAVLQESLLRVWQLASRHEPDGRPNSLLRFAVRVARNAAISELRRQRGSSVDPSLLQDMVEDDGAELSSDPLLRALIHQCRDKLPDKPSLALGERLQHGGRRSDRELAAQLGMTPNTFLQNITRARRLLAACLERQGVELDTVLS
jgi:RNA polymerase sigma-70 factor (ECF subfamily)